MGDQLALFGASPARCTLHGPGNVCEACPERFATDHTGFVHRDDCRGRIPLRKCHRCGELTTPGNWNHADWFHCLRCVPLGQLSELGRLSSPSKKISCSA